MGKGPWFLSSIRISLLTVKDFLSKPTFISFIFVTCMRFLRFPYSTHRDRFIFFLYDKENQLPYLKEKLMKVIQLFINVYFSFLFLNYDYCTPDLYILNMTFKILIRY